MKKNAGFTLLEMLAALSVFALIAALTYAAVAPSGRGFAMLAEKRVELEGAILGGRRLRLDVSYASPSQDRRLNALRLHHDQRGGVAYDELWLLVRLLGMPGLSMVHYYLDEEKGMLVREVVNPLARGEEKAGRWALGKATGLEIQALDGAGRWHDEWDAQKMRNLPRALRIRWLLGEEVREYLLPLFVGVKA